MNSIEETTADSGKLNELRAEMAAILGVAEPVAPEVLRAAVDDSTYAHNLLVCRRHPEYLAHLLANPPKTGPDSDAGAIGLGTLLGRAVQSLAVWARTGFSTVSDAVYRQRLAACAECPNLQVPPAERRELYQLVGADADQPCVCSKCGCVVTVKARRTSDTCPEIDPKQPLLNRWGETVQS